MTSIQHNLQHVRERISAAAAQCGRDPAEITLLAVSKTKPASAVEEAVAAGSAALVKIMCRKVSGRFGTQENPALIWHFIGPLQSNKSRLVAEHFHWCHTVDRLKIALRLNEQRPASMPPLNVLIQINISDENSKSGIMLDALPSLAKEIAELPHLSLRGLMAIPAPEPDYQRQLAVCQKMADAFTTLKKPIHPSTRFLWE